MRKRALLSLMFVGLVWSVLPQPASAAPPANDNFADATTIVGTSGSISGTNVEATREQGEPGFLNDVSVWYNWTAPASGTFYFCVSADYDSKLGIYTGPAVDELVEIDTNDDYPGMPPDGYGSRIAFPATQDTIYRIGVTGYANDTGNFTLDWSNSECVPPQPPEVYLVGGRKAVRLQGSRVTVQFAGYDDTTAPNDLIFRCNLNDGGWTNCSSPFQAELPAGSHQLRIFAIDEDALESDDLVVNFTIKSKKLGVAGAGLTLEVGQVSAPPSPKKKPE